ncbi:MAG: hypothetical protein ABI867_28645 [Kofleriaceae bacterium]
MRALVLVVAVAACDVAYDPVEQIPHREYPDTATAVRAILADTGTAHVYAVGEYHPTQPIPVRTSPLERFTHDVMPELTNANHLVVEAWFDASCAADPVQQQIQAATNRAATEASELVGLVDTMPTRGLPMTCIEHSAMLDPRGRVDFLRLLSLITEKLRETTLALVHQGRDVVVYGGALHNDLYPRWPLEDLAYADAVAHETSLLELDLAVPEVVAPLKALWVEDWFPLLGLASPDRVIVWERGPNSYVLILPAEDDRVASAIGTRNSRM